jgi:hypothetical protein
MQAILIICLAVLSVTGTMTPSIVCEQDVTFQPGNVTLSGFLTWRPGRGPGQGVVLRAGGVPQTRNSVLTGGRPFGVIAEHLVTGPLNSSPGRWMRFLLTLDPSSVLRQVVAFTRDRVRPLVRTRYLGPLVDTLSAMVYGRPRQR